MPVGCLTWTIATYKRLNEVVAKSIIWLMLDRNHHKRLKETRLGVSEDQKLIAVYTTQLQLTQI